MRLVLGSRSPARLATLRAAGIEPVVLVSSVDEDRVLREAGDVTPTEAVTLLAEAKAAVVARAHPAMAGDVVIGCDSMLELDGRVLGKPADADEARARWRAMRGRTGHLHSGHCVILADGTRSSAVSTTAVHFADVSDEEIDAYVATGEPLHVAGAFTIDGLGGAFVRGIDGDHHGVVGISLPLVREMLVGLGVRWTDLWTTT
ncbi:septum formation protein [Paraoerskovia marina]|uniref:Nucleoside triphosphate pyrophosphatase n=1 Tax=Paraoerskovia marina TaxID=545619 RepID=A0A1H1UJ57_9CELL|nr:Maf family protein [Paraoerskovia marina]SDS72542.1 septum formation protein [Paraoerskovia marina]